ncbi:MAG: hypothetical protein ACK48K_21110, partial [Planctomycetota bacterium]
MGRSIVFSNHTPKKLTRKTLRRGIQALLVVACVSPICIDSAAHAQLRTGREAAREYYPQATSTKVPRSSSHSLRDQNQAEASTRASKPQRSLESISDDPVTQDLTRLPSIGQAESLPKVLAAKATSNRPVVNQPVVNRPVVTEVAQTKLEAPSQVHSRSDSGLPPSSIA